MGRANIRSKRKVASALRAYSRRMDGWMRWSAKTTKMRPRTANAFLLGVMLDRSIRAEAAWAAAERICDVLGDPERSEVLWEHLAELPSTRLRGFLRYGNGGYAFHRHYKTFARLLPSAGRYMLDVYGGDPRVIWNGERDVDAVRDRLEAIPAIGPALARMAVLILARNHGLLGGRRARKSLAPKPDIMLKRVFRRTGLVGAPAHDQAIVDAARALARDFPAALDAPAWEIGRTWCKPARPRCSECPLVDVCPRVGLAA